MTFKIYLQFCHKLFITHITLLTTKQVLRVWQKLYLAVNSLSFIYHLFIKLQNFSDLFSLSLYALL